MIVLEAIQRSAEFLERKGVDSPRLQAELLLAHVLHTSRMKLYLSFDRMVDASAENEYRALIQRRGRREPLQHIVGTANFCGLELAVNGHVLVPRPETELLAERAVHWIKTRKDAVSVLDFGTGSGCLAIYLATQCPSASIQAVDVSAAALQIAAGNARRHGVDGRIQFIEAPNLASLSGESPFDLVVSNPPYIPSGEISSLMPEVRDHDPRVALDGGEDGLDFYRMLSTELVSRLTLPAGILVEFGDGQGAAVQALFSSAGWGQGELIKDYSGCERIFIAQRSD